MIFLRGGEDVTAAALSRFFGFHVAVLPGLTTALILLHLLLVQRLGISIPPKLEVQWTANPSAKREMRFFPNFLLREMMAWYVALGVLGALAALFPWNLGVKADPFVSAPAGIKPEWYFLFMFQTLKLIPSKVWFIDGEVLGVLVFGLVGLLWLLLPFFESDHPSRAKHWITGVAVFALAYVAGMSLYDISRFSAGRDSRQPDTPWSVNSSTICQPRRSAYSRSLAITATICCN
jgi:cytochrome b6